MFWIMELNLTNMKKKTMEGSRENKLWKKIGGKRFKVKTKIYTEMTYWGSRKKFQCH